MAARERLRVGGGSAYGNDRLEPALRLITDGNLDYLAMARSPSGRSRSPRSASGCRRNGSRSYGRSGSA
jgi:hypothetical protein